MRAPPLLPVLAVLVLGACHSRPRDPEPVPGTLVGPAGAQVASADGKLTLTIPPGALPDDVEISIEKLDAGSIPPGLAGSGAVYRLRPDGLQFDDVVTVRLRLDQEARTPDGTLSAEFAPLLLVSESTQAAEFVESPGVEVDGDANTVHAVGGIRHFTLLVKDAVSPASTSWSAVPVFLRLRAEISDVPTELAAGEVFPTLLVRAESTGRVLDELDSVSSIYHDLVASFPGAVDYDGPEEIQVDDDLMLDEISSIDVDGYFCREEGGPGFYNAEVVFFVLRHDAEGGLVDIARLVARFAQSVTCKAPEQPEAETVSTSMSGGEGIGRLGDVLRSALALPGSWSILVAASTGAQVCHEGGCLPGNPGGENVGAAALTYIDGSSTQGRLAQAAAMHALFLVGPQGFLRWNVDPTLGPDAFGFTEIVDIDAYLDIFPYGGDPESGGAVVVNATDKSIGLLEFDADLGNWRIVSIIPSDRFAGAPADKVPVSAWRATASEPVFVLWDGQPGRVYRVDDPLAADPAVLLGDVGNDPRRIRGAGSLLFASNYGDATLSVLNHDAVLGDVGVGNGPVGIDAKPIEGGGGIEVASTGSTDQTWSYTTFDAAGTMLVNRKHALPGNAGHILWLRDAQDRAAASMDASVAIVTPVR